MLSTTRVLLTFTSYGPAVVALIDSCAAHHPGLFEELARRAPLDADTAPEKLALAISNHGRLHRGETGWDWYESWCVEYDEASFVATVIDHLAHRVNVAPEPAGF
jgi:hypothetical protein